MYDIDFKLPDSFSSCANVRLEVGSDSIAHKRVKRFVRRAIAQVHETKLRCETLVRLHNSTSLDNQSAESEIQVECFR